MEMVYGEEPGEKHPQLFPTPKMEEQMMLFPVIYSTAVAAAVL